MLFSVYSKVYKQLNYVFESVRARAVVDSSGLDVVMAAVVVATVLLSNVLTVVTSTVGVFNTSSSETVAMASLSSNMSVSSSDGG